VNKQGQVDTCYSAVTTVTDTLGQLRKRRNKHTKRRAYTWLCAANL